MASNDSDPTAFMRELVIILASGDDQEDLKKSSELCHKASELAKEKSTAVQKDIEELRARCEGNEKLLTSFRKENKENEGVLAGLGAERKAIISNIDSLHSEVGGVEVTMKQAEHVASTIKEEKASIQRDTNDALPKTKYAFSLYSNITKIRWDYESDPSQLKGFVVSLQDVKPFSLNLKDDTEYDTANYLWDLITPS